MKGFSLPSPVLRAMYGWMSQPMFRIESSGTCGITSELCGPGLSNVWKQQTRRRPLEFGTRPGSVAAHGYIAGRSGTPLEKLDVPPHAFRA